MDLHRVLPAFPTSPHADALAALARANVQTADLAALSGGASGSNAAAAAAIARRARLPAADVARLADAVAAALLAEVSVPAPLPGGRWRCVSTLDERLDRALGGGFPAGYVTEITGESGAGKTQLLLTLLLAAQLPPPHGLGRPALYLSTEAALPTARLASLAATHPLLAALPPTAAARPSLSRVHAIRAPDLEAQEHIVRYQLPEAARRCGAGLVVVDSVAAHFRAEMLDERERGGSGGGSGGGGGGAAAAMAERRARLVGLGALLRRLARDAGAAVVVSNQVADRIGGFEPSSSMPASAPATAPAAIGGHHPQQQDPLALDHQQRWFTGWGDSAPPPGTGEKTPTLGLAWANQIAGRVALVCESPDEAAPGGFRRRWMRVVFAKWAAQTGGRGVEFRITSDGVEGVDAESGEAT